MIFFKKNETEPEYINIRVHNYFFIFIQLDEHTYYHLHLHLQQFVHPPPSNIGYLRFHHLQKIFVYPNFGLFKIRHLQKNCGP